MTFTHRHFSGHGLYCSPVKECLGSSLAFAGNARGSQKRALSMENPVEAPAGCHCECECRDTTGSYSLPWLSLCLGKSRVASDLLKSQGINAQEVPRSEWQTCRRWRFDAPAPLFLRWQSAHVPLVPQKEGDHLLAVEGAVCRMKLAHPWLIPQHH